MRSCTPVKVRALKGVRAPRAIGRWRVRVTWGSRFRSQRSLMEQPAPRIMRAPLKKRRDVPRTERGEAIGTTIGAARRVEKRQGNKR